MTTMTSSEELQRVLKAALEATPSVMALAHRVYDHVTVQNPYGPLNSYIAFGPLDTVDDDTDGETGSISALETTFQIDIWSKKEGAIECRRLTDLVRRALHHKLLVMDQHALVDTHVQLTRVFPDPTGEHHGVVQVTCLVQESD